MILIQKYIYNMLFICQLTCVEFIISHTSKGIVE